MPSLRPRSVTGIPHHFFLNNVREVFPQRPSKPSTINRGKEVKGFDSSTLFHFLYQCSRSSMDPECRASNPDVVGSNPTGSANFNFPSPLWQSQQCTCLVNKIMSVRPRPEAPFLSS